MSTPFAIRPRRAAALLGAAGVLVGGATALAATPVNDGRYTGRNSEGHSVALRTVAGATHVHWVVNYGRSANCNPKRYVSRAGSTFDHRTGAPVGADGAYREVVSSSNKTTFNGHSGYRVRIRAVFSGRFDSEITARGSLEQRATFFRPDGSQLATCVRRLTYTARLR
jgi:hypothetical protein